ncbi:MAG: hypothetical protein LBR88_07720 [Zoogloeaceae bacterium]|jgi:hypothetical protein|nr:hypothetical protein [Zoogloeaceae bacterium]
MPLPASPAESGFSPAAIRARYQEGLLLWLKSTENGTTGLAGMIAALEPVAQACAPAARLCAVATLDLLYAIAAGQVEATAENKRLAARADLELKRAFREETVLPDDALLRALREALPQPATEASIATAQATEENPCIGAPAAAPPGFSREDPLAGTLAATASLLPLFSQSRELRFATAQRKDWDAAVEAVSLAWAARQKVQAEIDWQPLRRAVFKLLEGALPLEHPAPLRLAEAFASALDDVEIRTPAPRRLTAMAATVELIAEAGFLEHEALNERVAQLARRLESEETGVRSQAVNAMFATEAAEETAEMRHALEAVPPDTALLAESAERIRALAEPMDLSSLALAAFRFANTVERMAPILLDHPPGRDHALGWIAALEQWIAAIGDNTRSALPIALVKHHRELQALAGG